MCLVLARLTCTYNMRLGSLGNLVAFRSAVTHAATVVYLMRCDTAWAPGHVQVRSLIRSYTICYILTINLPQATFVIYYMKTVFLISAYISKHTGLRARLSAGKAMLS